MNPKSLIQVNLVYCVTLSFLIHINKGRWREERERAVVSEEAFSPYIFCTGVAYQWSQALYHLRFRQLYFVYQSFNQHFGCSISLTWVLVQWFVCICQSIVFTMMAILQPNTAVPCHPIKAHWVCSSGGKETCFWTQLWPNCLLKKERKQVKSMHV